MRRQWKIEMGLHGYDWRCPPTDKNACHCVNGIGFFRKRKAHDCGNPGCGLCHFEKQPWERKKRRRERLAAVQFELEL